MKIIKQPIAPGVKITTLDYLTLILPSLVITALGTILGGYFSGAAIGFGLGLFSSIIWSSVIIAIGIFPVGMQGYVVVERFGRYRTVLYRGLGWVNPVFDRIHERFGTLRILPHKLYQDEAERAEVDFKDASAMIYVTSFYGVGNQNDIANENWAALTEEVLKYTYTYKDPNGRADSILDGKLRPLLEEKTLEEAQRDKSALCTAAAQAAADTLALIGLHLPPAGGLIIEDIDLPDSVIALRELALEGQKQAEAETFRLQAPARAVRAVQEVLKTDDDPGLTTKETIDWLMTQQGLETIKDSKANITLIGKDVPGILNVLGVGKGKDT